ncbi:MAG: hypothetical protein DWQ18_06950 [Crenarchaeota archaeon]|nr:MAG: hypothetical protein DWQ17_02835 [Thermoproteota archaeon]RDJ32918.1 MAG: hypothetical protein DWQ18_06950 [Thermoproteota archaeon]RDJ36000.1 MAG: hypothetical protein DWQ13_08920 [Thermoproteota archaeon]RDJ38247.1 MAG: hypothetical protein DWQ19_00225 [Thermoproteota archaeon]
MAIPLKNTVYEMIKDEESLTDSELSKALVKEGIVIAEDRFNKLLLDLEILGLIKVSWLAKDTRRIEVVIQQTEQDVIDEANKEMMERDYEASFPGAESD